MEKNGTLLIFGCGFTGKEIARTAGTDFQQTFGTHRNLLDIESTDYKPLIFNGQNVDGELQSVIEKATHIIISIAPGEAGDAVINACKQQIIASTKLCWIGYLSTVGVYGNHDGAWVDEETPCRPRSKRSIWRMAAEESWKSLADQKGVPLAILRLSGIYGRGRNAFVNIKKGSTRRLVKPGQVFNRIHHFDIAQAVLAAAQMRVSGLFNITDDEPAPPQDVVAYAHHVANKPLPPEIDFETAELSPMARSFYGENKRVSNQKSKTMLALKYKYPNYREALEMMWQNGTWQ